MKNEVNDLYNYGYKIVQNKDYFKFSLDSILLADFVKIKMTDKKLCDLCTGNCPIPVILSSKIDHIDAIEYQKEIFEMGLETIKINNISNINIINDNAKNWDNYFKEGSFDIVTCNPPYFKYKNSSITNENMVKSIARHEISIKLEDIVNISYKLLKPKGRLYLVHKANRFIEIIDLLMQKHFGIKRLSFAYYDEKKDCSTVLIEAMKDGKNDCIITNPIYTNNYRSDIK